MDENTAQRRVRETFKAPFDEKRDRDFINELCFRKEIARQYLLGPAHKPDKDAPPVQREVILSSYFP
jgi:hypothetical protein